MKHSAPYKVAVVADGISGYLNLSNDNLFLFWGDL